MAAQATFDPRNNSSLRSTIMQALQGGTSVPQAVPAGAQVAGQTAPEGFNFQDPVADMNFLEKLALSMGGAGTVRNFQNDAFNRQIQGFEASQEAEQRKAFQDIGRRMQTGELDRESALAEYAAASGDLSGALRQESIPAAIQEFKYVSSLGPEQKALYFQNKRANQSFNLGGKQVVVSPEGKVVSEFGKTLAPGEQPEVRGEQARATAQGAQDVALSAELTKKIDEATDVLTLADEAEALLQDATGGGAAAIVAKGKGFFGISDKATQADAALKVISGKLVSGMPRMEGPQSDKDVQLYKEMAADIANPEIPIEDRLVALKALRGLQSKYTSGAPSATPATPPASGEEKIIDFGSME